MATGKDLSSQIHGQRISRSALVLEARDEVERTGSANYLRAEYVSELAKVVVNNHEPLFAPHQPQVRASNFALQDWADAYDLISQFFDENQLELTRSTATLEFPLFKAHRSSSHSALSSEARFQELMVSSDHGKDFSDRVRKQSNVEAAPAPAPAVVPSESPKLPTGSPRKVVRKKKVVPEETGTPAKKTRVRTAPRQSPKQTSKKATVNDDGGSSSSLIDDEDT
jgi:hypothetical protein